MRNRNAIWIFTILLVLACLYQLSFSWVTGAVEKKAKNVATTKLDSIKNDLNATIIPLGRDTIFRDGDLTEADEQKILTYYESQYLNAVGDEPAYPITGLSYNKCKSQQLTQGLDLQGGMAVTLQISIPDLVYVKAGETNREKFVKPFKAAKKRFGNGEGTDFIELFFEEHEKLYPGERIDAFNIADPNEFKQSLTKDELKAKLKSYADESISKAQIVIEERVKKFGIGQVKIQPDLLSGRLYIEIPGAKDKESIRYLLQKKAELEFWVGFEDKNQALNILASINTMYEGGELDGGSASEEEEIVLEEVRPDSVVVGDLKSVLAADFVPATAEDSANVTTAMAMVAAEKQRVDSVNQARMAEKQANDLADAVSEDGEAQMLLGGRLGVLNGGGALVGYARSPLDTTSINLYLQHEKVKAITSEITFLWSAKPNDEWQVGEKKTGEKKYVLYAAKAAPIKGLTGENIYNASYSTDPSEGVVVNLSFDDKGSATWGSTTTEYAGKGYIGISLDKAIYSFPFITEAITGGSTRISGDFSLEEAELLSKTLNGGSLPARPVIVDDATVGAELGEANVQRSLWSFIFALLAVLVYMIFYYSRAGMIAGVALVANIFFIVGTLASLGTALTLPGIAGLVLTIGMAVDANVLIFERIREELRVGKGIKQAIADGYKHAYSAILDSNITSLLTAIILSYFGSGPIQDFAVTLIVGVFASLFSSIFITRLLFSHMLDRKMKISFSIPFTENWMVGKNINFLGNRKKFYGLSAIVVIGGIISIVTIGLNPSVEFTGGRQYTYAFSEAPDVEVVKDDVTSFCIGEDGKGVEPVIKTVDNNTQLRITTNFLYSSVDAEANSQVEAALIAGFEKAGYTFVSGRDQIQGEGKFVYELSHRSVNPQISAGLLYKSIVAIVIALIAIFLYIGFRFSRWQFGLGALIAMFHDVLVVLGLFSILWKVMPFSMEIDQAFIAAVLTVIGYSINDTVVVYDRIREFIGTHKRGEQNVVINKALNTTLSRTINTSATTFVVLLIILIFGGESIKGFSFALMVGVVVGTYSSIFIATPSVVDLTKNIMPVKADDKKKKK